MMWTFRIFQPSSGRHWIWRDKQTSVENVDRKPASEKMLFLSKLLKRWMIPFIQLIPTYRTGTWKQLEPCHLCLISTTLRQVYESIQYRTLVAEEPLIGMCFPLKSHMRCVVLAKSLHLWFSIGNRISAWGSIPGKPNVVTVRQTKHETGLHSNAIDRVQQKSDGWWVMACCKFFGWIVSTRLNRSIVDVKKAYIKQNLNRWHASLKNWDSVPAVS